jgi:hypothetical protein
MRCAQRRATDPSTPNVDATALDRQLDDLLAVEIGGVGGEGRSGGVLDTLVDGQDGQVAGAGEPAVREQALEAAQHTHVAIAG